MTPAQIEAELISAGLRSETASWRSSWTLATLVLLGVGGAGVLLWKLSGSDDLRAAPPQPAEEQLPEEQPPGVAPHLVVPEGYALLRQTQVTPEMTAWAVETLRDLSVPMGGTVTKMFDGEEVLARVEWHPPNPAASSEKARTTVHRGVTLYAPKAA